jgi:predicted transcriptional regulator
VPTLKDFYDLLFEVSNEDRHRILLQLEHEPINVTQISKNLGLSLPETSRHISRLNEVGLTRKDTEGLFHLTAYGRLALRQFRELEFSTKYRDYFTGHTAEGLPPEFVKRIGDLSGSVFTENILDFIRQIEYVIKEAKEYVWLLVDQFPLNHLSLIVEAIERGVQFRVLEPRNRVLNPDLEAMAPEESHALSRMRQAPIVEQRMLDEVNTYMYLSENDCVSAFPTLRGENEYKGFKSTDETSLKWCRDLFQHYWNEAVQRISTPSIQVKRGQISTMVGSSGWIVIVGRERIELDAQAIQDAVDNYDEVILKGRFNIGTATININRSVKIRGEGRTDDIPDTKIYKKGWKFPFLSQEFMFDIRGEDIDVTIENIHVEDFNGTCINTRQGNSVTLRKNRITLSSGLGRGLTYGSWGDHVVGITAGGESRFRGSSPGGVMIEDNYLDFALSFARGGFVTNIGLEREPDYRPDLKNHETPICVGMLISRNLGKVIIRNNVIRNMNARGILVADNWETADIEIVNNTIISEVFGAYPYNNPMSGVGILVQSAWSEPRSGGHVMVEGNKIICDKVNYCGIAVYGPAMYQKGAGKLEKCIVVNNEVSLKDGSIGVIIRRSDLTEVSNNKILGKAYYGLQISGSENREGIDLYAYANIFEDNDMESLVIKEPNVYSDSHVDGRMFTGSGEKSATANVWLNNYTKGDVIKVKAYETVIDEGEDNKIEYGDQA